MAAVSTAVFAFMLVVAMSMAYPVHKEKLTDQDLIKAIMHLWNEKTEKDHYAEATNHWTEEGEKDQESLYRWNGKDNDRYGDIDFMNPGRDRNDDENANEAEGKDDHGWKSKERYDNRVIEAMKL